MAHAEWLLGASEEADFLRLVLNHVSNCLVAVDTSGTIVLINEPYCQLLDGAPEDFLGRHITDVVGPKTKLHLVARGEGTRVGYPLEVRGRKLVTKQVPVRRDGRIIGAVGLALFADFDALQKTYSRITGAEVAMPNRGRHWLPRFNVDDIIGRGERMESYRAGLAKVARYDLPILIHGETGSGKELAAQAIHGLSDRASGPFVWVNCASLPGELIEAELFGYEGGAFTGARDRGKPGKFELAAGGILFLDEIGDMPLALQASLLRVLQTNQIVRVGGTAPQDVNVRVVCATHRSLTDVVREGRFREDLYYRLNVLTVDVPALRDREDVIFLAERLLARIASRLDQEAPKLTETDRSELRRHSWPGNVRELENVLTRFIVTGRIVLSALSSASGHHPASSIGSLKGRLRSQVDEEVRAALEQARGNKRLAAESLGISRAHLYRLLKTQSPV